MQTILASIYTTVLVSFIALSFVQFFVHYSFSKKGRYKQMTGPKKPTMER